MDQEVGRYRILSALGRGSMGVVYLAHDPVLNRRVAIKMVDVSVDDPGQAEFLRSRLLRDGRAAAALSHPNIVTVHDVLEEGGKAYVVMEYIAGESLAARLKANPVVDSAFTLQVLREMASALDYTHARGIIHRDIKPGNVMIDEAGTAKIMDFGIARLDDAHGTTATGMVMGTIEYMAPEQIKGEALNGSADQFSLAAMAYQMMCGSTLFGQHSFTTLAYKIVNEEPQPVRTRNTALPPGVDAVLAKALSKTPAGRFVSCSKFVDALAESFALKPPVFEEPTRTIPVVVAPRRRPSGALAAVAVLILAGAALAIWKPWAPRVHPPPSPPATSAITQPVPPQVQEPSVSVAPPNSEPKSEKSVEPRPTAKPNPPVAAKNPPVEQPEVDADDKSVKGPGQELYDQAQDSMKAGRYDAAIQSLTKAIGIRAGFARAYLSRAMAYQHLDQSEAAVKDYSEVIRLRPRNALAYYERGICYSRLTNDDLALADYNQALQLKPDMPLGLNARGMVYLRRKEYRKAIADFSETIRLSPQFAPAYQNRGRAKQANGNPAGAKADFDKAMELKALKSEC